MEPAVRQLSLPFYGPCFPAPERAALTMLYTALWVAQQALREEHASIDAPTAVDHHAPVVLATARLIVGRCAELAELLDLYDTAIDDVLLPGTDEVPF